MSTNIEQLHYITGKKLTDANRLSLMNVHLGYPVRIKKHLAS